MGSLSFHALIEVRWMTQKDYQLKNNPIITKKMYGVYEVAKYQPRKKRFCSITQKCQTSVALKEEDFQERKTCEVLQRYKNFANKPKDAVIFW